MNKFGHIEDMKVIFFWKCAKVYADFEYGIKIPENVDGFDDNCVWTCVRSFCQLWQEYMWWAVSVLKRVLRFPIQLRDVIHNSICLILMEY